MDVHEASCLIETYLTRKNRKTMLTRRKMMPHKALGRPESSAENPIRPMPHWALGHPEAGQKDWTDVDVEEDWTDAHEAAFGTGTSLLSRKAILTRRAMLPRKARDHPTRSPSAGLSGLRG